MRSRAARGTVGAIAGLALAAAAYFVIQSQQQIGRHREAFDVFEAQVHAVDDAVAGARAGMQAYVAAGQGLAFWVPKVSTFLDSTPPTLDRLGEAASNADTQVALMEAGASSMNLAAVDKRIRDYLRSGQSLMASGLVLTEGNTAAATQHQT